MNPRIVVTITTIPDRYDVLSKTIDNILRQTLVPDAIYLSLPKTCRRLNKEYPPLPNEIKDKCIIIEPNEDYGPITKLYGGIISESEPDTIIISLDDDVIYDSDMIEKLVYYGNKFPDAAICATGALIKWNMYLIGVYWSLDGDVKWNKITGFNIDPDLGRNIDIVYGVGGVLYRRKFFPTNENLYNELFSISMSDDSSFHNDDVVISGYLNKNNIKRKIFPNMPMANRMGADNALSSATFMKVFFRMNDSINYMRNQGYFDTTEPMTMDESVAVKTGYGILFIIFLIIAIILALIYLK